MTAPGPQFRLSGFADEISQDPAEQVAGLLACGVRHIEVRGVGGKNSLDLSDAELDAYARRLADAGIRASAIGSPVGKSKIGEPAGAAYDRCRRAVEVARRLEAPFVRMFSFYVPEGREDAHAEAVVERLARFAEIAEEGGVALVNENERGLFGATAVRVRLLAERVERIGVCFDPENFVGVGEDALAAWKLLAGRVRYIHIKDRAAPDAADAAGEHAPAVPAGLGIGRIPEILADAKARGWTGFLSLEPHLKRAGKSSGETGLELFRVAADALKGILDRLGARWA